MSSLEEAEGERLLSQEPLLEDARLYTGDGSVDSEGSLVIKHQTGNWRACIYILGTECCERLAYYGIAKNLVTYLSTELHEGNAMAARNIMIWQGTCYLTPLIGAVIADSYLGKYRTIAVFSVIYFIGMATLTLSASVRTFKPHDCVGPVCPEAGLSQSIMLFLGLYMIALGAGGIKPCVSSFGADQFDDTDPVERERKGSFFNWFYFSVSIGAFVSGTVLVWIQDNYGWGLGFGIPTLFMGLAIGSFIIGLKVYRFQKTGGSPFTRVCQVIVASVCKWNINLRDDYSLHELDGKASGIEGGRKMEHTAEFKFFDKAAIVTTSDVNCGTSSTPWRVCTVTQVEELKMLIRMFPIWATNIVFFAVCAQSSLFLEQGMVLDKRIGSFNIPPASLSTFDAISVILWVPVYDKVLVPTARRFTGKERGFSQLQRLGIGQFLSILAMTAAALVETKRLQIAKAADLIHQKVAVPMSIFWQIPQYSLVGAAEVFTFIGLAEFFYDQAPDAMRSLCSAFGLLAVSLGSYLSSFILTVITSITAQGGQPGWIPDNLNEGHLDRFFWLIDGLCILNLLVYVHCAIRYKYKKAS